MAYKKKVAKRGAARVKPKLTAKAKTPSAKLKVRKNVVRMPQARMDQP
jgi:hypothetical protein